MKRTSDEKCDNESRWQLKLRGAEEWGFDTAAALATCNRFIRVRVSLRRPALARLVHVEPAKRRDRIARMLDRRRRRVLGDVVWQRLQVADERGAIEGTIHSSALPALVKHPDVDSVTVVGVRGRRRSAKDDAKERWHAVVARFAIEVEGQRSGMQTVEERVILLMATDEPHARARFGRYARADREPYLNDEGKFVRWNLVAILDIQRTMFDELDAAGTEVYSRISQRRFAARRPPSGIDLSVERARRH